MGVFVSDISILIEVVRRISVDDLVHGLVRNWPPEVPVAVPGYVVRLGHERYVGVRGIEALERILGRRRRIESTVFAPCGIAVVDVAACHPSQCCLPHCSSLHLSSESACHLPKSSPWIAELLGDDDQLVEAKMMVVESGQSGGAHP